MRKLILLLSVVFISSAFMCPGSEGKTENLIVIIDPGHGGTLW
mgnify:CR=1 FL=1